MNYESFYVKSDPSGPPTASRSQYTTSNLWPSERSLPGFRATFEELYTLVYDVRALIARACDQHTGKHIKGYESGYLEQTEEELNHKSSATPLFSSHRKE